MSCMQNTAESTLLHFDYDDLGPVIEHGLGFALQALPTVLYQTFGHAQLYIFATTQYKYYVLRPLKSAYLYALVYLLLLCCMHVYKSL